MTNREIFINYLTIGVGIYSLLCYADFKGVSKPKTDIERSKKLKMINIFVGFILTVFLWPIPLIISFIMEKFE